MAEHSNWSEFGLPTPPNTDYERHPHEAWMEQVLFALYSKVDRLQQGGCERWKRVQAFLWVVGTLAGLAGVRAILDLLR